jgi:hypothetical protein
LAAGRDRGAAFRFFEETVAERDLYVYGSSQDGILEFPKRRERFYPGFLRQLFATAGKHLVYKTWSGTPSKKSLGLVSSVVINCRVLVRGKTPSDVSTVELSAMLTGGGSQMPVPMDVHKYVSDPKGFFALLKLNENSLGGDVVNFTDTGVIVVKIANKELQAVRSDRTALKKLVGLDKKWSGTVQWKSQESDESDMEGNLPVGEVADGMDGDTLLMVEVAAGAFVVALVLSLIGFWVYKGRSEAKGKSSSSVSHPSSSDDAVQEGIMETCE